MILNMVRKLFSGTVYVRISEDRLRVHHLENGSVFDQPPLIAVDASNPRKVTLRAIGDEAQGLETPRHRHPLAFLFHHRFKQILERPQPIHESRLHGWGW